MRRCHFSRCTFKTPAASFNVIDEMGEKLLQLGTKNGSPDENLIFGSYVSMEGSLRERVLRAMGDGVQARWNSLPEVQNGGFASTLPEDYLALEELKFCLITCEVAFNVELVELVGLSKKSVAWADPLPAFNRRTIASTIEKVKRCSDVLLNSLETQWNASPPTLSMAKFCRLLTDMEPHFQNFITYCTQQEDLRTVLRTAVRSRPEIRAASFSNRLNVERALLPIQHLKLVRQLLQDIRAELAPMTKRLESFHCRRALNQVTKVLEECYKTLTTLHGAKYVEKLDLLLEESVHGCDKNYFKKCLKEIPSSSKRVVALRKVCQSGNCQAVNGRSKYSNLFVNNKTCNRTIDFNRKLVLRRGKSVSFSRRKTDALKRQSSPIFGAWENKLYKEIKSNNFRTLRSKGRPLSASCLQIDKNIKNVLESTNKLVKNKDNATVVQITKARDDVQSKCQNDLNVYDKGGISAVCNGFCKTEGTSAELCPTENEESRTKDDDDMPSAYEEIDDGKARVSKQSFVSSYDIGCMTRKYVHTLARDIADLYESYKPMNENLKRNHNSISPSKFKRKMDIDRQSASPFDIRKLQAFNGSENTYEEVEPRDGLLTTYREVPLYQAYKYQNVRKSEDNIYIEPEEHVYEEIGDYLKTGTNDKPEEKAPAMEIGKPSGTSQRVRWADIPEVMESGLLDNLDSGELALQEAKYEIITSEASYFKSLAIVDAIFVSSPELAFTLSKEDYDDLFSDIKKVKQCSEKFLVALLDGWQDDIMLGYLCQAVSKFVDSGEFQVYVNTCENRLKIGKTLEYLKLMNSKFTRALSELEADPVCQNFTLQSFLTLPMQRVTRLPLLIQAILRRLPVESCEHQSWKNVLVRLQEVANECNEAIGKADKVTVEQCNQLNTKILTLNSKEKKKQQTIWNFLTLRR